MHIHIQNRQHNAFLPLTRETVDQATAGSGHAFTLAQDDAGFAEAISTTEVLVTTLDQVKARFPCVAPRLRAVFLMHAGVDGFEGRSPLPDGVMLLNNSGAHARKAGEFALMASLMLVNNMQRYVSQQQRRLWQPQFAASLAGRRITVVGTGGLGSGVAKALRPLDVQLTGVRNSAVPHPDFDVTVSVAALDGVLEQTETLILAAPLTPASRGMIGAAQLHRLPRHAHLINIGRGELVDQSALIEALDSGSIAGAMLDVQEIEPIPAGDPLWSAPNLFITPHISATDVASYGKETLRILLDNVRRITNGQSPPNLVDLVRGY